MRDAGGGSVFVVGVWVMTCAVFRVRKATGRRVAQIDGPSADLGLGRVMID